MPHIAVTMLPGRDRETKQKLAENLCNTLIETLGVDAKIVSCLLNTSTSPRDA